MDGSAGEAGAALRCRPGPNFQRWGPRRPRDKRRPGLWPRPPACLSVRRLYQSQIEVGALFLSADWQGRQPGGRARGALAGSGGGVRWARGPHACVRARRMGVGVQVRSRNLWTFPTGCLLHRAFPFTFGAAAPAARARQHAGRRHATAGAGGARRRRVAAAPLGLSSTRIGGGAGLCWACAALHGLGGMLWGLEPRAPRTPRCGACGTCAGQRLTCGGAAWCVGVRPRHVL